jgi:hypothetical protein
LSRDLALNESRRTRSIGSRLGDVRGEDCAERIEAHHVDRGMKRRTTILLLALAVLFAHAVAAAQSKGELRIEAPHLAVAPGDAMDLRAVGGSGSGYRWLLESSEDGSRGSIDERTGHYVAGPDVGSMDDVRL